MLQSIKRVLPNDVRAFLQDARSLLNRFTGIDVSFYDLSHPFARIVQILHHHKITVVLDVGANRGRYALHLRRNGYRGIIHSFEPLAAAYSELEKHASKDPQWCPHRLAIGESDRTDDINVSGNEVSSSLLAMTKAHERASLGSGYVRKESVDVRRLDTIWSELVTKDDRVFLKMDTQGMEECILRGASDSFSKIDFIQAELSFVELYEGEMLFADFVTMMRERKCNVVFVDQAFTNEQSGIAYQCDVIFQRMV